MSQGALGKRNSLLRARGGRSGQSRDSPQHSAVAEGRNTFSWKERGNEREPVCRTGQGALGCLLPPFEMHGLKYRAQEVNSA